MPSITTTELDRTQTFSIGLQDLIALTSRLRATIGFSADYLKGLHAQQYDDDDNLVPLTCISDPTNTSFRGCTPHVWTYNPQMSVSYYFTDRDMMFVTFADRGRFPLLKESYSTKFESSLPNPDLEPEHSRNWNFGYSHIFSPTTMAQIEYFHNGLKNSIHSVYITDTLNQCPESKVNGYCSINVNIAEEAHQGVEITLRSKPVSYFSIDFNYSYLNRTLMYEFANMPDVSEINTAIDILPTLAKNKVVLNTTFELPYEILALGTYRFEGGLTLQDTTYNDIPPAYGASHGVVDIGTVVPVKKGFSLQVGIKNLFDKDYYYAAGYPEAGRNWYFNSRYRF